MGYLRRGTTGLSASIYAFVAELAGMFLSWLPLHIGCPAGRAPSRHSVNHNAPLLTPLRNTAAAADGDPRPPPLDSNGARMYFSRQHMEFEQSVS